ncbi:MAG: hypothetical protein J5I50_06000 [Chitinophagaceae bacterium]|nr:hypothetical protein [Chitinophagaceae bacterium]
MNKQLIVYMPLMILCIPKMDELKKKLKEEVLFFVLQLLEIVLLFEYTIKTLNINILIGHLSDFQFSVSDSGFSVFIPASGKFNSLYPASDSLKRIK